MLFSLNRYVVVLIGSTIFCLTIEAENICSETPPENRAIDGIPAYAQCDSSQSSSIYSNNGIDTRTSSGGAGWVRTQGGGGYQCTEFASRYLKFRWNVKSVPTGNAGTWGDNTLPAGLAKTTMPVHGDIIVFGPGSCGAGATTGHVAVIDIVDGASLTIVEQNGASRRKCATSCAKCYLHAEGNTGVVSGRDALNRTDAISDISVQYAGKMISIGLRGDFAAGATVRVYNLLGQQIADLTDNIVDGRLSLKCVTGASMPLVVSIRKGNRSVCRRILAGE